MSVKMYVSKSVTQATSTSTICQQHLEGYEDIQKAIQQFVDDSPLLQGKAYESAKAFYNEVLFPLVQAGILLTEATEKAVKQFPEQYQKEVDHGDLSQDELEDKIRQADSLIHQAREIKDKLSNSMLEETDKQDQLNQNQDLLDAYIANKKELEEKLRKLLTFHSSSPRIFSEIASLKQAITQGLSQAKKAWNVSTGVFSIPQEKDLAWIKKIQEIKKEQDSNGILDKAKDITLTVSEGAVIGVASNRVEEGILDKGIQSGTKKSLEIWQNRYSMELPDGSILGKTPGATQALRETTEHSALSIAKYGGKALTEVGGLGIGVGIDMLTGDSAEEAWGKEITTGVVTAGAIGAVEVGSTALVAAGLIANPIGISVVGAIAIGVGISLVNDFAREHFQGVKDFEDGVGNAVVSGWNSAIKGGKSLLGSIFG